jgi:predicted DNA-binding protein
METQAKTARISLYVTPTCRAQLELLWRETGRQKSDIVADAINHYFETLRKAGQIRVSP